MHLTIALTLVPALLPVVAQAQQPATDTGAFVVTLGNDTISAESYRRTGSRVEGVIARRVPRASVIRYVMDLAPSGLASRIQYNTLLPDGSPAPNAARAIVATFTADSVFTEIRRPAGDPRRDTVVRFAVKDAYPEIDGAVSFRALPIAAIAARRVDSADFVSYPLGSRENDGQPVIRRGSGRHEVYSFGSPIDVTTDAAGRILALDAARTTSRIKATRHPSVDVMAFARNFAEKERVIGPMTSLSPRNVVNASIGGATMSVDHGSPSARGRVIWGPRGVLGDTLWRTGANATTQFKTDAPLNFGGRTLPAGQYTLTTLAIPGRYHLIFSVNGAEMLRVPLQEAPLTQKEERFMIAIDSAGSQVGVIRLRWDALELRTGFAVGR